MNELKKADEIVSALRQRAIACERTYGEEDEVLETAADLIDSLTAQLTESQRRERDARNELCQRCGRYHEAHNGACDGCRWKETEQ